LHPCSAVSWPGFLRAAAVAQSAVHFSILNKPWYCDALGIELRSVESEIKSPHESSVTLVKIDLHGMSLNPQSDS
jgi:hypothetical protein